MHRRSKSSLPQSFVINLSLFRLEFMVFVIWVISVDFECTDCVNSGKIFENCAKFPRTFLQSFRVFKWILAKDLNFCST